MTKHIIICGLGNIGASYVKTRHNVGFMCVDAIAKRFSVMEEKLEKKFSALISNFDFLDHKIMLVKPSTYMNNSGEAIGKLVTFYKNIDHIIIIRDDLDLDCGKIKISNSIASNGHNGIKSVNQYINSYLQIKIGIGRPQPSEQQAIKDYVLLPFTENEVLIINNICDKIAQDFSTIISSDISLAVNFSKVINQL